MTTALVCSLVLAKSLRRMVRRRSTSAAWESDLAGGDCTLTAQALVNDLRVVTRDPRIAAHGVNVVAT